MPLQVTWMFERPRGLPFTPLAPCAAGVKQSVPNLATAGLPRLVSSGDGPRQPQGSCSGLRTTVGLPPSLQGPRLALGGGAG